MKARIIVLSVWFLIASLSAVPALPAGTNVSVGVGGTTVIVPAPDGFVEVGPKNRKGLPFSAPESRNRLLAWFVTAKDLKKFDGDSTDTLRQYMQVQVSKRAENIKINPSQFSELANEVAKQNDASYALMTKEVNQILNKLASNSKDIPKLELGTMKPMGSFMKTDRTVGLLTLLTASSSSKQSGEKMAMIAGMCLVRVREKLLFAYVYCAADENNAVDWVKTASKSWVDAILKANGEK